MSLTVMLLIFQSGGYLPTTMKLKSWQWWECSCLSTMQQYSALATSSDVQFIATTPWFSCGPCISPLCHTGLSLILIDLDVYSVSTVEHHKFFKSLDTQYRPLISKITICHLVTTLCLGTSAGVYGVSVLETWQQLCYMSVSLFWDLFTPILQRSSHLLDSRSRDNDAYSISCLFLVLLSATAFSLQHFTSITSHPLFERDSFPIPLSPHYKTPHITWFHAWRRHLDITTVQTMNRLYHFVFPKVSCYISFPFRIKSSVYILYTDDLMLCNSLARWSCLCYASLPQNKCTVMQSFVGSWSCVNLSYSLQRPFYPNLSSAAPQKSIPW